MTRLNDRVRGIPAPITTRRLRLERPSASRNRSLVVLLADPAISRWTLHIPFPYKLRHARLFLRTARAMRTAGRGVSLQIVRRSDGALLGGVGLHKVNERNRTCEIGYWLGRPYRGLGYASEAVRALTAVAFRSLALHRVEALVFPGNRRSEEVLLRSGFRREGVRRGGVQKGGRFRNEIVYSRLRSDRAPGGARRSARHPERRGTR